MPADSFVATTHLRFIERDLGHQRTGRILQQQWVANGTLWAADLNDSNSEWRDVPLVGQEGLRLAGQFEKRHAPLPVTGIEEIALSEAATKAWNDDRRERAERALKRAGFTYTEGAEEWKPPLGQPPAFLQEGPADTSDIPEAGPEFFERARVVTPAERVARVDASLAKQLQNAIENNGRLVKTLAEVKAQLPAGMQSCTIVFEECPKGHGSLRATNWVKGPCLHCRIQKQQDALRWICQQASSGHRENLKNVAREGLEP